MGSGEWGVGSGEWGVGEWGSRGRQIIADFNRMKYTHNVGALLPFAPTRCTSRSSQTAIIYPSSPPTPSCSLPHSLLPTPHSLFFQNRSQLSPTSFQGCWQFTCIASTCLCQVRSATATATANLGYCTNKFTSLQALFIHFWTESSD